MAVRGTLVKRKVNGSGWWEVRRWNAPPLLGTKAGRGALRFLRSPATRTSDNWSWWTVCVTQLSDFLEKEQVREEQKEAPTSHTGVSPPDTLSSSSPSTTQGSAGAAVGRLEERTVEARTAAWVSRWAGGGPPQALRNVRHAAGLGLSFPRL